MQADRNARQEGGKKGEEAAKSKKNCTTAKRLGVGGGLSDWKSLDCRVESEDVSQSGQHSDSRGKIEGDHQVDETYIVK